MASVFAEQQQVMEQQEQMIAAKQLSLDERDAELQKLRAALKPPAAAPPPPAPPSFAAGQHVGQHGQQPFGVTAVDVTARGAVAARQLFHAEGGDANLHNSAPSSSWLAAELSSLEAEMADLHQDIDRTATHLDTSL